MFPFLRQGLCSPDYPETWNFLISLLNAGVTGVHYHNSLTGAMVESGERAQQVKASAVKPAGPSLLAGSHVVEERTDSHICNGVCTHSQTHKISKGSKPFCLRTQNS